MPDALSRSQTLGLTPVARNRPMTFPSCVMPIFSNRKISCMVTMSPSIPVISEMLVTLREHPLGTFVALHNVTPTWRTWPGRRAHEHGVHDSRDAITGQPLAWDENGDVRLEPYAVLWLTTGGG